MDLADASLVVVAEHLRTHQVFTLDSDFHIDRLTKVVTQDLPTMWATPEEVSSLRPRTAKIDELITVAECAIHLTQERRTSLIAAAVTGQIRVG